MEKGSFDSEETISRDPDKYGDRLEKKYSLFNCSKKVDRGD